MKLTEFGPASIAAAKYVATRSVLNPLLWLDGLVSVPSLVLALFASPTIVPALLFLGLAPPSITMLAYIWFMFSDPNRLQSEEFVIQQQWVRAQIGDNRTKEVIDLKVELNALTANTGQIESGQHG